MPAAYLSEARSLFQGRLQHPRLAQDVQPRGFGGALRFVIREPLFVFRRPGGFHRRERHAAFVHLRQQDGQLFARDVQIRVGHFTRRLGALQIVVCGSRIGGDAFARACRFDVKFGDIRVGLRGFGGTAMADQQRELNGCAQLALLVWNFWK